MERLKHRYIVIEGPIGVGKTTLTRALCKRFRGRGLYEIVEEEPVPVQLLPGPPEVRLPDPALLPALRFKAAAGPVPAGSVQQR